MNVLCYLQPHRGGGVGRHSLEMVRGLLHRGDVEGKVLVSGREARRHPQFMRELEGISITTHALPERLAERSWKLLGWPSLRRHCRGFDVIYAPAEVRFPDCGIPRVMTIHDIQALETDLPWSHTSEHAVFRQKWSRWVPKAIAEAARILTVSEFSKRRMVELLGADPAKIAVVGNGVADQFFVQAAAEAAGPRPSVVVIGGLRLKKGAEATLRVAEELARRKSPLVIDIFGQHDPEWAARAAGHTNVSLHGYVDDAALSQRLAASTALLFLSPYEGFGIPAVEAMAAGTPAVVANAASLPEIVGDAGILVDPIDSEGIATILDEFYRDSLLRQGCVARGRIHAARFTWQACVDRLITILKGAV